MPTHGTKRTSMGKKLGLKLDVATVEEMEAKQDELEASFGLGSQAHLIKRSKNGDVVVRTSKSGGIILTKGGGAISAAGDDQSALTPEDFKTLSVLGRGASSRVDLVRELKTGKMMALKVINVFDKSKRGQIVDEIAALYQASCPTLVTFYGVFFAEGTVSIALEYMDQGCLASVLERCGPFPEPVLAAVAFQALWGLAYFKHEKRVHRDVKPQNILVNSKGQVKLTDFGISRELEDSIGLCMTFVGTFKYMSPERIQSQPYGFASDIWSIGLVLLECGTGRYPYPECNSYIDMVQTLIESPPLDVKHLQGARRLSDEFQKFINCTVRPEPKERVPADILLASPWLQEQQVTSLKPAQRRVAEWLEENPMEAPVEGERMVQTTPRMAERKCVEGKLPSSRDADFDETKFASLSLEEKSEKQRESKRA